MYTNMHDWREVRRRVLVEEMSKRAACNEFDLYWSTLAKILDVPSPPGCRVRQRVKPKLGGFLPVIDRILEEGRSALTKQRHTATRIYCRLRDEFGYRGGSSVVRDAVRNHVTWTLKKDSGARDSRFVPDACPSPVASPQSRAPSEIRTVAARNVVGDLTGDAVASVHQNNDG